MCGGTSDVTKQNSKQSYTPAGYGTMQGVINRADATSQLPYTPILQGTANLTPQQLQAMGSVGSQIGVQSPYMTSAAAHFENAANPLSAADINQYYNPYAASVMANMNEVFGQQRADTTGKLTQAAGGVGADRIAVGQSELARQQGLAAGQTLAGLYQNAAQLAQNQQGVEQASAYGLGNLSQAEINQSLATAGSLFGMGSAQQMTEQQALNAIYNQQMAQAAYPFQTAQWYAGLALPAAGAQGGTSKGMQTVNPPDPNMFSQIAGLGLTALGAFAKDGGRIEGYATGGSPFGGTKSYVPDIDAPAMQPANAPPISFMSPGGTDTGMGGVGGKGSNVQAGKGASNLYSSLFTSPDTTGSGWDAMVSPSGMGGWGNFLSNLMPFKKGGSVEDSGPYKILHSIARGKGGEIDEDDANTGQPAPTALGDTPIEKNFYYMPATKTGLAGYKRWELDPHDLQTRKEFGNVTFARGGEVEGYAFGGGPYTPGGPMGLFNTKAFEQWLSGYKPTPDRIVPDVVAPEPTATAPIPPELAIAKTTPGAPQPKGPAGFTIDEPATPVPGLADTAGAPGGIANDPWAPLQPNGGTKDYSVYTPEEGYQPDPLGKYVPGKQYKWSNTPQDPSQITSGPGTIPEGDTQFTEGVDGPVSPNATSRTLAADAGEPQFKGAGRGRWSAAFGNVPPWERPKLFGKELSNMNIALMAAGLGMLGGGSPYFGVNVGQGGLKGIEALQEFQKLDANRQAQYLQNMLEAGRLDVAEQQAGFTRYDKMIDNERQLAVYYDGIGDTEKANAHQQRADELTRQYYGGGDSEPVIPGSVPEGAEAAPQAENAPAPEYSIPEPPQVDFSHQSKDARAINKSIGLETLKKANEQYDASQSQSMLLAQTRHALNQMPKDGLLTAGPGAQFRNEFARFVNTAYAIGGAQPPIDPTTVGSIEELKKLTTRMGFDLARTLGTREAMQVIQQAVGAVPGAENTPMGARRIMAGIQAGFIRDRDWYEYLDAYAKKNGGDISGAKVAFNKARPTSYYIKMSEEIVAAQTLVADGKMSQEEAVGHLIEQGINPEDVF